jgi:GNAT superfamily N-acetyltransferase
MTDDPTVVPVTPARWDDTAKLLASCGDARGCWCAFWYCRNRDFRAGWGKTNRRRLQRRVRRGDEPGVLAYKDGVPVGWCGVAPRQAFERLKNSRVLAPVDERPVWSITCFVVAKGFRRQGLMRPLLDGAVALARRHGAKTVEAYPIDPQRKMSSGELYTGAFSCFLAAGFREVARRSPHRPIVRLELIGKSRRARSSPQPP